MITPKLEGLIFPFAELVSECELFKSYAKDVLDPTTVGILDEVKGNLQNIQKSSSTSKTTRWQIPQGKRALRTIVSDGASQPGDKSGSKIRGRVLFRVGDSAARRRQVDRSKTLPAQWARLDGLPRIVGKMTAACIAHWTVEIGDQEVSWHSLPQPTQRLRLSPPFSKLTWISPACPRFPMSLAGSSRLNPRSANSFRTDGRSTPARTGKTTRVGEQYTNRDSSGSSVGKPND